VRESNPAFYHKVLRRWVAELDSITPYWPGSPSSGYIDIRAHNMKEGSTRGDTHLWQIWHGMKSIETFRDLPTRFCSEYGMESMPSMSTVRLFTDLPSPKLSDSVMQLHQKSGGGNEKILYYLLAKYREPAAFEDFVYLSQLVQANTVRSATDSWRRGIGRTNGALFWQLNDCWPVASWAGIDYGRQKKAVVYQARHFNKMLCLSNDYYDDRAEIYVENEYPRPFRGRLQWKLSDFSGALINSGELPVTAGPIESKRALTLNFGEALKGRRKTEAWLEVALTVDASTEGGEVKDLKTWLLVPDKKAALPKANVRCRCSASGGIASVQVSAEAYARYVYLEAEGVTAPWSDNFFDIRPEETVTVTVALPEGIDAEGLAARLKVKTLTDVAPKNSALKDQLTRASIMMSKKRFIYWLFVRALLG
jgi:beta-mannosidase